MSQHILSLVSQLVFQDSLWYSSDDTLLDIGHPYYNRNVDT
jgi:hypothetical protein